MGWGLGKLFMSDSDGLFPAVELEHVDLVDVGVEVGAGVKMRHRAFDPDAVMLVPPSLDEWLLSRVKYLAGFPRRESRGSMGSRVPDGLLRVDSRTVPRGVVSGCANDPKST